MVFKLGRQLKVLESKLVLRGAQCKEKAEKPTNNALRKKHIDVKVGLEMSRLRTQSGNYRRKINMFPQSNT